MYGPQGPAHNTHVTRCTQGTPLFALSPLSLNVIEEKLCGSRHMCGPTGRMSRAARRSHTARIARRSHTAPIAHRSHTHALHAMHAGHTLHALHAGHTLHAGHAPIVSHCTQVAHYTVSVLSKRGALKSRMSRTHNAWQAVHPGNARMSRTARTTRMSHI